MQTVVIVIHLLIVIALVGVVLIQRSEGGGLGIGGGSGFMTARGTRNALTRVTAILAGCFFLTSLILTILQTTSNNTPRNLLDRLDTGEGNEFIVPSLTDNQSMSTGASNGTSSDISSPDVGVPESVDAPEVEHNVGDEAQDELVPSISVLEPSLSVPEEPVLGQ